ncbi:acyloxyacyl hydrolase [Persicitalea sp.]|uniref:acyloxyacyl hydrolase n=1 Tax=Persicitalea sp. TaxID=3100273 RepID=UPI003593A29C
MKIVDNLIKKRQLAGIGLLLVFLVLAGLASAQSRFALSANASPILKLNWNHYGIKPRTLSVSTGIGAGANLHYYFSPHWSASSGLWLEWTRHRDRERLTSNTSHHFNVPLLVNFQTKEKRLAPYFTTGLVLSKFRYGIWVTERSGSDNVTIFDVAERTQLNLLLAAGVKYKLNDHLSLAIQPTFISNSLRELNTGLQLNFQTQLICRF